MRIRISVKPEEVNLGLMRVFVHAIGGLLLICKRKARAVSVLVGVEKYVRAIIFVVTDRSVV
jgi:hypothetical protein